MYFTKYKLVYVSISLAALLAISSNISAFTNMSAIIELHVAGLYGRVHAWNNVERVSHKVNVEVPANAPIIISDYHSKVGANGLIRSGRHSGIDMFAETGTPVIAAADGKVIKVKNDRCWGPTLLIRHGRDKEGQRIYALYGHVRNIIVEVGQRVRRGDQIAEMGEDLFTNCGGGIHHLHFQLSFTEIEVPILGWGWAGFVADGFSAPNPHKYWENGEGKVTCFEPGKKYSRSGLTYPLPCLDQPRKKPYDKTIYARNAPKKKVTLDSMLDSYVGGKIVTVLPGVQKQVSRPIRITREEVLRGRFVPPGTAHFSMNNEELAAFYSNMRGDLE